METTALAEPSEKSEFEQELARDLAAGELELPSFPDIVVKIRSAISDESCTPDKIVQLLGAEPTLAARIINMSNSAALAPSGDAITDIRAAVMRIGFNMVRNTTMSYGVVQTKSSYTLKAAKDCLNSLWDESAHVAALCFVLAKKLTKRNPDEALLIGLMHSIGKLYILSKAEKHPTLFGDGAPLMGIMDEWHAPIGSAILDNWGFEAYVAAAIADYRNYERQHDDEADYTDILTMATMFSMFMRAEDNMEFNLNEISASRQLNIGIEDMIPIIEASSRKINSLHRALGM